jgi:putative lipoprotein (rSAM/lipoprotein system)
MTRMMRMERRKKPAAMAAGIAALWLGLAASCSVGEDAALANDLVPPTANYIISGTVVSEKDAAAGIPDLQVVISHTEPHPGSDTCLTGQKGEFVWDNPVTTFGKDLVFTIAVSDIDGERNGSYAPCVAVISFSKDELDNEISWFLGEGRKEVLIKMKESVE